MTIGRFKPLCSDIEALLVKFLDLCNHKLVLLLFEVFFVLLLQLF